MINASVSRNIVLKNIRAPGSNTMFVTARIMDMIQAKLISPIKLASSLSERDLNTSNSASISNIRWLNDNVTVKVTNPNMSLR